MLEVSGYSKVAFVGFSLGTTQTFYGMAKDANNFYKEKISVFIALAPCTKLTHSTFSFMNMGSMLYDRVVADLSQSGVKALYGPNWMQDKMALCNTENFVVCMLVKEMCIGDGQAVSTRAIQHSLQTMMKDNFVEFDPALTHKAQLFDSAAITPIVMLSNIRDVPIHMFVGKEDTICSPKDALWTKD